MSGWNTWMMAAGQQARLPNTTNNNRTTSGAWYMVMEGIRISMGLAS
ncbi:MAG: hypothetical protein H6596_08780 [Flavobacteriales bacterium]|nr:hypothetical protein [Flavobacteriales bacterium]